MLVAKRRVGRLITIRINSPVLVSEVPPFESELQRALGTSLAPVAFCTDLRGAQVMDEKVTSQLIVIWRRHNAQLLRTALVLPADGVVLGLQVDRLVREAGSPARKTFRSVQTATLWLAEVLSTDEQSAVVSFLEEPVG